MNTKKFLFLLLTIFSSAIVIAQVHLGKSKKQLIAVLGVDYSRASDGKGNDVLAYFHEIKNHPRFGDYTLYSIYVFNNDVCTMQQSIMPVKQLKKMVKELNEQYEPEAPMIWKSKEDVYYVLSEEADNLRLKMMKEEDYRNYINSASESNFE